MDEDEKDRWVRDPFTQRMLEAAKKKRAEAVENLINASRVTTDVRVMEAYSKLMVLDSVIKFAKGEQ